MRSIEKDMSREKIIDEPFRYEPFKKESLNIFQGYIQELLFVQIGNSFSPTRHRILSVTASWWDLDGVTEISDAGERSAQSKERVYSSVEMHGSSLLQVLSWKVLAREGKSKGRQMSDAEATIGGKKSSSCTDQSDRGNDFAVLSRTILNTL